MLVSGTPESVTALLCVQACGSIISPLSDHIMVKAPSTVKGFVCITVCFCHAAQVDTRDDKQRHGESQAPDSMLKLLKEVGPLKPLLPICINVLIQEQDLAVF